MASSLFKAIKKFGVINGLVVFGNLKIKRRQFRLPSEDVRVFLRNTSHDSFTFKETFFTGQYETDCIKDPKFIIDAGANIGISTLYFAKQFPAAQVLAVEPDPDNYEILKLNASNFKNVITFNGGVWYRNANLDIIDNEIGPRGFSTIEVENQTDKTVNAITIGEIFKKQGSETIDVLKIDIEGSEKEVFSKNYEDWLPKTKVIIIELHDRMVPGCSKSFFSAISEYNFSLNQIIDENLIFTNDDYVKLDLKSYLRR